MQDYQKAKERLSALKRDLYQKRLQEMQPCSNRNFEGDCRIINKLCPGFCPEYEPECEEEGDINE